MQVVTEEGYLLAVRGPREVADQVLPVSQSLQLPALRRDRVDVLDEGAVGVLGQVRHYRNVPTIWGPSCGVHVELAPRHLPGLPPVPHREEVDALPREHAHSVEPEVDPPHDPHVGLGLPALPDPGREQHPPGVRSPGGVGYARILQLSDEAGLAARRGDHPELGLLLLGIALARDEQKLPPIRRPPGVAVVSLAVGELLSPLRLPVPHPYVLDVVILAIVDFCVDEGDSCPVGGDLGIGDEDEPSEIFYLYISWRHNPSLDTKLFLI